MPAPKATATPPPDQPTAGDGPPKGWHPDVSWTPGKRGHAKYGKHITAAESQKRAGIVAELLVAGVSRAEIWRYLQNATDWEVSITTVDRYTAAATAALAEEETRLTKSAEAVIAEKRIARRRFAAQYHRADRAGDHGAAVRAQRELSKILDHYPETRGRPPAPDVPPEPAPATPSAPAGPGTMAGRADLLRELLTAAATRAAADGVPLTPPPEGA